ncbi:MAG: hypothetical protein ACI89T_001472 [Cognaticolwellia sp.]|jgi:hypothetical protein
MAGVSYYGVKTQPQVVTLTTIQTPCANNIIIACGVNFTLRHQCLVAALQYEFAFIGINVSYS